MVKTNSREWRYSEGKETCPKLNKSMLTILVVTLIWRRRHTLGEYLPKFITARLSYFSGKP